MRKQAKGVQLIVGGDVWNIVEGSEDLAAFGPNGSSFGVAKEGIVVVDPDGRRIITGTSFDDLSLGAAIVLAIDVSTGTKK